jgi:hypothetical protein
MKGKCGAYARSTGKPCQAGALRNGRCRNHGGLSTGPRTEAGRKRIGEAARTRLAAGDQAKLLAGFRAWLERRVAKSIA